jgi:hypothetical protein
MPIFFFEKFIVIEYLVVLTLIKILIHHSVNLLQLLNVLSFYGYELHFFLSPHISNQGLQLRYFQIFFFFIIFKV